MLKSLSPEIFRAPEETPIAQATLQTLVAQKQQSAAPSQQATPAPAKKDSKENSGIGTIIETEIGLLAKKLRKPETQQYVNGSFYLWESEVDKTFQIVKLLEIPHKGGAKIQTAQGEKLIFLDNLYSIPHAGQKASQAEPSQSPLNQDLSEHPGLAKKLAKIKKQGAAQVEKSSDADKQSAENDAIIGKKAKFTEVGHARHYEKSQVIKTGDIVMRYSTSEKAWFYAKVLEVIDSTYVLDIGNNEKATLKKEHVLKPVDVQPKVKESSEASFQAENTEISQPAVKESNQEKNPLIDTTVPKSVLEEARKKDQSKQEFRKGEIVIFESDAFNKFVYAKVLEVHGDELRLDFGHFQNNFNKNKVWKKP